MASENYIQSHRREACSGCCACAAACPHGAIRMEADGMGFRYPVIDQSLCVECGLCEKVCALKPVVREDRLAALAVRFPEHLGKSQSGGVGYALLRKAVEEGMVVYGAALDADFVVRHRRVDSLEGLEPLRLSKYVQSDMDGIPQQLLKDLQEGRRVLFSGTPCQCAGMGSLCARYRERLYLVDIVCHSAPAPQVWKGFLRWQEEKRASRLEKAVFRDPSLGRHTARTLLQFQNGESLHSNSFYFLFMKDLIGRPSCGECPFANTRRPSDLTMGDCQGVEKALPGFADDNRGCSLVLLNTPRGREFFSLVEGDCVKQPVDLQQVLQLNLREPSAPSPKAARFEKDFLRKGFPYVQARYGDDALVNKMVAFYKKVLRHLPL